MSIAMVKVFETAMNGTFDLTDMLNKIDTHHICGNLTDAERDTLVSKAREKADPAGGLDLVSFLAGLDARLRKLEAYHAAPEGGNAEDDNTEAVEQYIPGKWYRNGDQVRFDGRLYICTAPGDGVCVWSPAEYPAYWEEAHDA